MPFHIIKKSILTFSPILAGLTLAGCAAALVVAAAGGGAGGSLGLSVLTATPGALKILPSTILPFTSELNKAVISPDGSQIYAVDRLHNTLNIYDAKARKLIAVIDIPNIVDNRLELVDPNGATAIDRFPNRLVIANLVVSPNGKRVYISLPGVNQLAVVDTQTAKLIKVINTGKKPGAVIVSSDNSQVFVANTDSDSISIIDTNSFQSQSVTHLSIDNPVSMDISPDNGNIYVVNQDSNSLVEINPSTLSIRSVSVGEKPLGISVTPDGKTILVSNSTLSTVSLIDSTTLEERSQPRLNVGIAGTTIPSFIVTSPDNKLAFVANAANTPQNRDCRGEGPTRILTVIDLEKEEVLVPRLEVERGTSGMVINSDSSRAFTSAACCTPSESDSTVTSNKVTDIDINQLISNSESPDLAVKKIDIADKKTAFSLVASPDDSEIYVIHAGSISVIDTSSRKKVASIFGRGTGPFKLTLDSSNSLLLTANTGDNSISSIDIGTHTVKNVIASPEVAAIVAMSNTGKTYAAHTGTFQTVGKTISEIDMNLVSPTVTNTFPPENSDLISGPFVLNSTPDEKNLVLAYFGQFADFGSSNSSPSVSVFDISTATNNRIFPASNSNIDTIGISQVIAPDNKFIFFASYSDVETANSNVNIVNLNNSSFSKMFDNTNLNIDQPLPIDMAYHAINANTGKLVVLEYIGKRVQIGLAPNKIEAREGPTLSIFNISLDNNGFVNSFEPLNSTPNGNILKTVQTIPVGGTAASAVILDNSGNRAFVLVNTDKQFRCKINNNESEPCGFDKTKGDKVVVINLNDGSKLFDIPVGKQPLDIIKANGKAYIPNYFSNTVSIIDMENPQNTPKTVSVGKGPVSVIADNDVVYVSNSIDGTVSIISLNNDTVKTVSVNKP